jgi:hypothetical protein
LNGDGKRLVANALGRQVISDAIISHDSVTRIFVVVVRSWWHTRTFPQTVGELSMSRLAARSYRGARRLNASDEYFRAGVDGAHSNAITNQVDLFNSSQTSQVPTRLRSQQDELLRERVISIKIYVDGDDVTPVLPVAGAQHLFEPGSDLQLGGEQETQYERTALESRDFHLAGMGEYSRIS